MTALESDDVHTAAVSSQESFHMESEYQPEYSKGTESIETIEGTVVRSSYLKGKN